MKKRMLPIVLLVLLACQHEEFEKASVDERMMSSMNVEVAYPLIKGTPISLGGIGDREVVVERKNGQYVWMGDVIITQEQVDALDANAKNSGGGRTALQTVSKLWPTATVYYTINSGLPNQARVTDAIAHWQANAPYLRFIVRTSQPDYIEFVSVSSGNGCSSNLGKIGGRQTINLESACSTGNVIHEIGHALGLLHEQTRTDRNASIVVHDDNILPQFQSQFNMYSTDGIDGFQTGTLDFGSIMMYPSFTGFEINPALPAITRTNGTTFAAQRTAVSAGDLEIVGILHGPPFATIEQEIVTSSDDWTIEHTETEYFIRFYADRNRTTFANLANATTINFVFTENHWNPTPPINVSQPYSTTLQPGANRYSLGVFLTGQCAWDYGGPLGDCFSGGLYLNDGLRYNN